MQHKIDYISFTLDYPERLKLPRPDERLIAEALIDTYFSGRVIKAVVRGAWEVYSGGRFYKWRVMDSDTKFSVSFHPDKPYFTVECSGQTCDVIVNAGCLDEILHLAKPRCTRIDFAVDFESDCTPAEFIGNNNERTIKGHAVISTETGVTQYVGSWNSERFARVYRYHEPSPRSHLLRAEVVSKGDYARALCAVALEEGVVVASLRAHVPYNWQHSLWQPEKSGLSKISVSRRTASQAGRELWLIKQVAPALRSAITEGWFDLSSYLREHVFME